MKYKLKEHVTDEMLVAVGFKKDLINSDDGWVWFDRDCLDNKKESDDIIIVNLVGNYSCLKVLQFNYDERPYETIKPYIQDLIDLDYVEVVE